MKSEPMHFRRTNSAVLILAIMCQAIAFLLTHGLMSSPGEIDSLATHSDGDQTLTSISSATSHYLLEGKRHNDPAKTKPPGRDCNGSSIANIDAAAEFMLVRQITKNGAVPIKKGYWLVYCSLLR